jgi:hypothetical protein
MINIANAYSKEYDIKFNATKSKYILCNSSNPNPGTLCFNNDELQPLEYAKHLGTLLGPGAKDLNIKNAVCDLVTRTNITLAQFKFANSYTRYKLFKAFCMAAYGCQLWDFSDKLMQPVYTAWRKCVRKVWRVNARTHNRLIHLICDDMPIDVQLHRRFFKFVKSALCSKNEYVKLSATLAIRGSQSSVCNSLNFICRKYDICKYDVHRTGINCIKPTVADCEDIHTASIIKELICERDNLHHRELQFTNSEIEEFLQLLCTV